MEMRICWKAKMNSLFFSFYFSFIIYSQLVKEKGKNERRLLQIHFSKKKLERRTKQKQKLNAQVKETR